MDTLSILSAALTKCDALYARDQAITAKLRDMSRNAQETYNGFQGLKISIPYN